MKTVLKYHQGKSIVRKHCKSNQVTIADTDLSGDEVSVPSKLPLRKGLRTVVCPHETMLLDESTLIPHHIDIDPTSGLYDIHKKMSRKKGFGT